MFVGRLAMMESAAKAGPAIAAGAIATAALKAAIRQEEERVVREHNYMRQ